MNSLSASIHVKNIVIRNLQETELSETEIKEIAKNVSQGVQDKVILGLYSQNIQLKRELKRCSIKLREIREKTNKPSNRSTEGPEPGKENWDWLM